MNWRAREILIVISVLVVGWLVFVFGLARFQQQSARHNSHIPKLPHYPGTEALQEQVVPTTTDWHKYWFQYGEDYPSTTVYQWYRDTLAAQGRWDPPPVEPRWVQKQDKERVADVFTTAWLSKDRLFELDLELVSISPLIKEHGATRTGPREPGMKVYVTLRRNMTPWLTPEGDGRG